MEGDYSLHSGCWLFVRLCIWSPYSPAYHLVLVPFAIHLYPTYHLISFQHWEPLCHRLHPLHQPIFFTTATIYHLSASVSQFHPTPSPTWLHLPSMLFYIPIASWPLSHHSLSLPFISGHFPSPLSVLMQNFDVKHQPFPSTHGCYLTHQISPMDFWVLSRSSAALTPSNPCSKCDWL